MYQECGLSGELRSSRLHASNLFMIEFEIRLISSNLIHRLKSVLRRLR
jgi:hypothetical protein